MYYLSANASVVEKHRGIFFKLRGVLLETPRCMGRWTAVFKKMTAVNIFRFGGRKKGRWQESCHPFSSE